MIIIITKQTNKLFFSKMTSLLLFHVSATSFVPNEEEVLPSEQPTLEANAVMEEIRSLESRMTVVEAAVAEIIEWIRTRGEKGMESVCSVKARANDLTFGLTFDLTFDVTF